MDLPSLVFIGASLLFICAPALRRIHLKPWHVAAFSTSLLALSGRIDPARATEVAIRLSPALLTIAALMVFSAVISASGLLQRALLLLIGQRRVRATTVFNLTFLLTCVVSALLSNDLAILMLTPSIIAYARSQFPGDRPVMVALVFAVFTATGVAPLPTSNPMNLIFVSQFEIPLLDYLAAMGPVSLLIWVISWVCVRWLFQHSLHDRHCMPQPPSPLTRLEIQLALLVVLQASAYVAGSQVSIPIWLICSLFAILSLWLARADFAPLTMVRAIDRDSLLFLAFIYLFTAGLGDSQISALLRHLYDDSSLINTALVSALGSAAINNHPMAALSLSALDQLSAAPQQVLAALIGGDIGPRLLVTGSLAGVLWMGVLRSHNVAIGPLTFMRIGLVTALPAILGGTLMLGLL